MLQTEEFPAALQMAREVFEKNLKEKITDSALIDGFYAYTNGEAIQKLTEEGRLTLWGVFEGSRLIGVSALQSEGHITMLYVDTVFHGQGYGSRLLEVMRSYAKSEYGYKIVTLNALPAETSQYFAKKGFVPMQVEPGAQLPFCPMQAKTLSYVIYEKRSIPTGWVLGTTLAGLAICAAVAVGFMIFYL
jgi:GNAT superfamily N-acetyltransferase